MMNARLRRHHLPLVMLIALGEFMPPEPELTPLERWHRELRRIHSQAAKAGPHEMHNLLERWFANQMAFEEAGFVDIHTETAKALWDTPPKDAAEARARRYDAKSRNFALLYGGMGTL